MDKDIPMSLLADRFVMSKYDMFCLMLQRGGYKLKKFRNKRWRYIKVVNNRLILKETIGITKLRIIVDIISLFLWIVLFKIYSLIYKILTLPYTCFIPFSVKIDKSVKFPHGFKNIFITGGVEIGKGSVIFQNTSIVTNLRLDEKGIPPKIGKNVLIGANSTLVGRIIVGDNAKIGAGTTAWFDIPKNATVVQNKPRIITNN